MLDATQLLVNSSQSSIPWISTFWSSYFCVADISISNRRPPLKFIHFQQRIDQNQTSIDFAFRFEYFIPQYPPQQAHDRALNSDLEIRILEPRDSASTLIDFSK